MPPWRPTLRGNSKMMPSSGLFHRKSPPMKNFGRLMSFGILLSMPAMLILFFLQRNGQSGSFEAVEPWTCDS